jgi:acyl-CoA reductase-like NAD-dependent aldehyde dehydrogenase
MGLLEPHGRGGRAFRRAVIEPRPIVVRSLAEAVAALEAANCREIVLVSAPGAGLYAGPGWWAALTEAAREAVPAARFSAILDCGDDAGAAMAAIRAGVEAVIFTGRADVGRRLARIAVAQGARLLTIRPCASG